MPDPDIVARLRTELPATERELGEAAAAELIALRAENITLKARVAAWEQARPEPRRYLNLEALADGRVSGNLSEWPALPHEAAMVLNELELARADANRLRNEIAAKEAARE